MGRAGFDDSCGDYDDLAFGRWNGIIASIVRGKNGQKFLRELLKAEDAE